jgi:uncharacterized FAD-dependent dehydrogenase
VSHPPRPARRRRGDGGGTPSEPRTPRAARAVPDELDIELGLDEPDDEATWRARAAQRLGVPAAELPEVRVVRRALDARRGRVRFHVRLRLAAEVGRPHLGDPPPREGTGPARVVIVGDGPAGLFAAYALARRAVPCTIIERGKPVQPRRHDLKALQRHGTLDPDSNYCFGEGGAGTYSDGKLYTRAVKRGDVRDVLEILVAHGAPTAILVEARPHVGSNRLPRVVTALREHLESVGVGFRFGARLVDLAIDDRASHRGVAGVVLADGGTIPAERVVLATGHSARDVYELLARRGVALVPKGFAVGVRVEHPQALIDRIQYGTAAGHPRLPPAAYSIAEPVDGRGVFSFCMCPGGFVVPAATEPDGVVVNGMSLSGRRFSLANSGIVVSVEPADLARAGFDGPLGGLELQRVLERAAFQAGGGAQRAPASRLTDFLARRTSTYIPGLTAADLGALLEVAPLGLADRLRRGLAGMGRRLGGWLSPEAVLIGIESRTSAPVRIPRDPNTLESPELAGLYPAGEGAGHAGGIVSAALDGLAIGEAIARSLG